MNPHLYTGNLYLHYDDLSELQNNPSLVELLDGLEEVEADYDRIEYIESIDRRLDQLIHEFIKDNLTKQAWNSKMTRVFASVSYQRQKLHCPTLSHAPIDFNINGHSKYPYIRQLVADLNHQFTTFIDDFKAYLQVLNSEIDLTSLTGYIVALDQDDTHGTDRRITFDYKLEYSLGSFPLINDLLT